MNERVAREAFRQAEQFWNTTCIPPTMQSAMQESVAKSRELFSSAAAVTLERARSLTELADTVWSSAKMLNDKLIQNATANAEAAFDAAHALAGAKSLSEAAIIQSGFVQQLFTRAAVQSREFFDLTARAADHVIETALPRGATANEDA